MNQKQVIFIAVVLTTFGIFMRLVPHWPNLTPVTAIAFAASLYLSRCWSVTLPLVVMFLSDLVIGFYDWRIMLSVYGAFTLIGLGSWLSRKYYRAVPVGLMLVSSSLFFFLVTNAAVWLFSPWYEKSLTGLFLAYELGLPFLRNMMFGDLIYTALLVGVFEVAFLWRTGWDSNPREAFRPLPR